MRDKIERFSWANWAVGMFIALAGGGMLNLVFLVGAYGNGSRFFSVLLGAAPGILLAVLSQYAGKDGLGQGVLTGACLIAIVGGVCGGNIAGTSMH